MATKEQKIQKQVLDYCKANNIFAWRNYNGPIYTSKGMRKNPAAGSADILGLTPCGVMFGFEIKENEKSKRSPAQIEWMKNIRFSGGIGEFVWDLNQVVQILSKCVNCPGDLDCCNK